MLSETADHTFLAKLALIYIQLSEVFGREDADQRFVDEIHLDKHARELKQRGISPDKALQLARGVVKFNSEDDIRAIAEKGA